jgi:serine/threonine protein phosphatase PrpC
MGGLMSVALETKLVSQCRQDGWCFTGVEMHGAREQMEDECIIRPRLNASQHLVALMDGHGGTAAATYAKAELCQIMSAMKAPLGAAEVALAMMGMDILLRMARPTTTSGCAIAGVLVSREEALVFHAGDSRVVVFDTETGEIVYETRDHKPTDAGEMQRICAAGGQVRDERVGGELALSRGLGDFHFKSSAELDWKDQQVTALPDCAVVPLAKSTHAILVYCDGVVERRTSNRPVVDAVCRALRAGEPDNRLVCRLLDEAFASGSTDNMSCVLIRREPMTNSDASSDTATAVRHFVDDRTVQDRRREGKSMPDQWIIAKRAFLDRGPDATNRSAVAAAFELAIEEPDHAATPAVPPTLLPHLLQPVRSLDAHHDATPSTASTTPQKLSSSTSSLPVHPTTVSSAALVLDTPPERNASSQAASHAFLRRE